MPYEVSFAVDRNNLVVLDSRRMITGLQGLNHIEHVHGSLRSEALYEIVLVRNFSALWCY